MNPPRLLLLAATTGYQTRVFAGAARRLGMDLVLATDRCHVLDDPWGDHAIPVRFDDLVASADALAKAGPFDGIMAVADRPTLLAAMAAERLGIPYNSPASVEAAGNKYLARQRFQVAGLPVPAFFRVAAGESPEAAAARAPYPCVLKPLDLSASRGVIRADNPAEFVAAFRRIEAILGSAAGRYIQVESFIEGREYALEGLLTDGSLEVLALFDKPDELNGPFFEETIYVTPSRAGAAVQRELIATVERAVVALGLCRGPLHAELRRNGRGAWILEVAARPIGGLCAKALSFNGGMPLEELLLRHAVGEAAGVAQLDGPASGVMMIPIERGGIYEDVAGLEQAEAVPGVTEIIITAKPGQKLEPLPEGASYLGFIFAKGDSPRDVEAALRAAHAHLRIQLAAALPVVK